MLFLNAFVDLTPLGFGQLIRIPVKLHHLFYTWYGLYSTTRTGPLDSIKVGLLKESRDFRTSNTRAYVHKNIIEIHRKRSCVLADNFGDVVLERGKQGKYRLVGILRIQKPSNTRVVAVESTEEALEVNEALIAAHIHL